MEIDPALDLVLERVVDIPPQLVWRMWTEPAHLVHWFTPAPWSVTDCEIDLRPGGIFRTVMRSPKGADFPNTGIFLEVTPHERLVFTDTLLPGYRPSAAPFFTGILEFAAEGDGTRYTAIARHADAEGRAKHEAMGFHTGWGIALDQLVAYAKSL